MKLHRAAEIYLTYRAHRCRYPKVRDYIEWIENDEMTITVTNMKSDHDEMTMTLNLDRSVDTEITLIDAWKISGPWKKAIYMFNKFMELADRDLGQSNTHTHP